MTTTTGPHGYPAITADPQRRTWVESSTGARWTCGACGKAMTSRDVDAIAAFVVGHAHEGA